MIFLTIGFLILMIVFYLLIVTATKIEVNTCNPKKCTCKNKTTIYKSQAMGPTEGTDYGTGKIYPCGQRPPYCDKKDSGCSFLSGTPRKIYCNDEISCSWKK